MARPSLTVLQILPALHGGGVEQGTVDVCAALSQNGHRALVMSAGGPMVQAIRNAGGEHLQWPVGEKSLLTLRFVPALKRLFHERQIDIVHPRSRLPAWITWLAWKSTPKASRPRLVTSVHGFYRAGRYSSIMTRGERVICVSKAVHQYVIETFPDVQTSRLSVIQRGIDPTHYPHRFHASQQWQQRWRAEHPQFDGAKLILLPGRLTRLKGHHHLLTLIGRLRRLGMNVHGLVAGGVDPRREQYAQSLREQVTRENLSGRIHFLGHRNDMREIMSVSDLVLAVSSQPESFGRTVLEALSLGRPVVGFSHGGVEEILTALYPTGLCAVADDDALLASVRTLLEQPVAVDPVSDFTLQQMVDQTLSLYGELATSPRDT